ncbi:hypothetical protein [Rhizobium lentis]|uniref:Uncharacterized protein n=1 Tax=Rhizobium lentis TaxID=1138194 RepID=A0A7W9CXW3_9HYPH|nr:hypothetical protein [Rhizobium lentis]MBB4576829.1 hypothetical protein [Rhizobium lentis]MBB5553136.1 hypothetical protein [Rhizobium lentis]MBB5563923.1 hypothetical protein [Rhizobium lentis]MBB5570339.1 hypothetical protein [Rhizobium lentis]
MSFIVALLMEPIYLYGRRLSAKRNLQFPVWDRSRAFHAKIAALDLGRMLYRKDLRHRRADGARSNHPAAQDPRREPAKNEMDGLTVAMLHQLVQQVEEGTKLTPNEHDLVVLFARRAGRVVTIGHCDLRLARRSWRGC